MTTTPSPKVVLVTGCGSGLGRVAAAALARRGHRTYAGLRDPSRVPALDGAVPIALDVTDRDRCVAAVQEIVRAHGRLDVLINNAGMALGGFLEQLDEDELRRVLDVNVFGVFTMTQAVLPSMREQGSGTIVNVSSMSGRMAFPGLGAYATSKFALEGMSEAWRHELRLAGIDLFALQPGAYDTDIWTRNRHLGRRARDADDPWARHVAKVDARFAAIVDARKADPDAYARYVVRLVERPPRQFRHPMGPGAHLRTALLRFVPFSWIEALVHRMLLR